LEAIGGFSRWLYLYKISPGLLYPGDNLLSRDITSIDREAGWWTDAPVRHHPPENMKQLLKQRYGWGKGDGALLRMSSKNRLGWVTPAVARLAAPLLGIWLALLYRNWRQMMFLPMAQYAWLCGYLSSFRLDLQKETQNYVA
jgi:hypothetical protein